MTIVPDAAQDRYDVLATGVDGDPYATYARLRRAGRPCRGGPATFVVSRYAHVSALLSDPRLGHERVGTDDPFARLPAHLRPGTALPGLISGLDGGRHLRVRRLLASVLTPGRFSALAPHVDALADDVVRRAVERGHVDAVEDLALPLQTAVACDLLGVPQADRAAVCRQAMALGRAIILVPFVTEDRGNGDTEARWLRAYLQELIADRARRPGDDVVSGMLAASRNGARLSADEVVDNAAFLLFAGFETVMAAVAGGLAALLEHRTQLARLRADRTLVASAVEEFLRWETPLQWVSRSTSAPVEVGGRRIAAGRVLLLLLASANRDEERFAHADRFDVGRTPNPHLAFGAGAHRCLGVALARSEGAAVLRAVLRRTSAIDGAGPAVRNRHPSIRSHAHVPLALTPAR